jgi:hypothetical protein
MDCPDCIVIGNAIAFCRKHSETQPPPGWVPDRSSAERAAVASPRRAAAPRFGRHRWNPATGELEE